VIFFSPSQMLNRIQTTTGVVTVGFVILSLIYNQTSINHKKLSDSHTSKDLFEYSNELNELRHDLNELKRRVSHIEQTFLSSTISNSIISWIQNIVSHLSFLSSSFILYTFFLYLFHLCVFNTSTTQTIKLLHIVNIISYSVISIFYTSFKHFHYSNLAWLLFVLLFIRLYVR
jgi:hypothetical protein